MSSGTTAIEIRGGVAVKRKKIRGGVILFIVDDAG